MTFTPNDLKHLEVMSRLQEQKTAPVKAVEFDFNKKSSDKSITFAEKLLTLSSKLRSKGFEKYADNLENKFVIFKSALTQNELLYRAHAETGEDLIETAHPGGDVEMAPAADGLGDVETSVSQHKKILDALKLKQAQTAAPQPVADIIDPLEVANKFGYLYNYINKIVPDDLSAKFNTLDEQSKMYYKQAREYAMAAQKIVAQLKQNAKKAPLKQNGKPTTMASTMDASQAIKIITSTLGALGQIHPINTLGDVQQFISEVMGWFSVNNPVKKASLIAMVKQALKVEGQAISKDEASKRIAQADIIKQNALTNYRTLIDQLKGNLETLGGNNTAVVSSDAGWQSLVGLLMPAAFWTQGIKSMLSSLGSDAIGSRFPMNKISNHLDGQLQRVEAIGKEATNIQSIQLLGAKIAQTHNIIAVSSLREDAKLDLNKSLSEIIKQLSEATKVLEKSGSNVSKIADEVKKLNAFKQIIVSNPKVPQKDKEAMPGWIDSQIQEAKTLDPNNQVLVDKFISENKEVEDYLNKLGK